MAPNRKRPMTSGWRTGCLAAAIIAGGAGLARPAGAETVIDALVAAYRDNPTLEAQRAALRATDETVPQALAGWRPTVTGMGAAGRQTVATQNSLTAKGVIAPSQIQNPKSGTLTITQPVFRGGRTLAGTRRAENLVRAGRAQLNQVEQEVLLQAATAYADVYRAQGVLELAINNEQVLRRELQAARDRFEVGEVTRTDVSQSEARLAGATAQRIKGEGDLDSTRAVYRKVTGQTPGKLERPTLPFDLPAGENELYDANARNYPAVLAALYQRAAAEEDVKSVEGELLPELSVRAQATHDEDSFSAHSQVESLGVQALVTIPFYEAGSTTAKVRGAKQVVQQRNQQIDEARRQALQTATQAWNALMTARATIKSFEAQVEANTIALEGVRQESQVGARTVLDVLDAEQELLNAQVSLVGAQRDEAVAVFQVRAAMGDLLAPKLNLPVQMYDVDAHYEEARDKIWGLGDDIQPAKGGKPAPEK